MRIETVDVRTCTENAEHRRKPRSRGNNCSDRRPHSFPAMARIPVYDRRCDILRRASNLNSTYWKKSSMSQRQPKRASRRFRQLATAFSTSDLHNRTYIPQRTVHATDVSQPRTPSVTPPATCTTHSACIYVCIYSPVRRRQGSLIAVGEFEYSNSFRI